MNRESSRRFLWKLAYWTVNTILVLSAILVFFGILGPLIAEYDLDYHSILAALFIMIGSIIVLVGIKKPAYLVKPILSKESVEDARGPDTIGFTILGVAFWIGGLTYRLTGKVETLVISFLLGVLISFLRVFFRGR
jgi:hypothetical protein